MRTIFDIGSNNGDDIPYYLLKAERVVAFEANPLLCGVISERFRDEIQDKRLIVESGILCAAKDASRREGRFYIHREEHVLSQFPPPEPVQAHLYDGVSIPVLALSAALDKYGTPHYAKIDVEHYDHVLLAEFFRLKSFPNYLSAECHSWRVVELLLRELRYTGFKLVNGSKVHQEYKDSQIKSIDGRTTRYAFPYHSAGPFGDDIAGPWCDQRTAFKRLLSRRLGWKDLHASRHHIGTAFEVPVSISDRVGYAKDQLRPYAPERALRFYRAIRKLL